MQVKTRRSSSITNMLFSAAESGNSIAVVSLLKTFADADDMDDQQNTALMRAVSKGHTDVVRAILKHKDQVGYDKIAWNNLDGNTALHLAVINGNAEIVAILLDYPQFIRDINAQNVDGDTALHLAARKGYKKIAQVLLRFEEVDFKLKNTSNHSASRVARICENFGVYNLIKERRRSDCNLQ